MTPVTTIEGFTVIGIEGRTSNALEAQGQGIIPALWARFMPQSAQIPHRADANTIALYTDYESDENGAYTVLIGVKVNSAADVPDGMAVREIPPGRYAVFTSDEGPLETVVPEAWQEVWSEAGVSRSFRTDFELYDTRAANPAHGIVDLYVGLK